MKAKFVSLALMTALSVSFGAEVKPLVKSLDIYESPTCGCCGKWSEYMAQNGFQTKEIKTNAFMDIKNQKGIKPEFMSCHTGVVGEYAIEGHVPHEQVERLLKEAPKDAIGISVPGMPQGSPGMEQGYPDDTYDVLLLKKDGTSRVYATYKGKTKLREY